MGNKNTSVVTRVLTLWKQAHTKNYGNLMCSRKNVLPKEGMINLEGMIDVREGLTRRQ